MNGYLMAVLGILGGRYILESLADWLEVRSAGDELPPDFSDWYTPERYRDSQRYLRDSLRLQWVSDTVLTVAVVIFILAGGFGLIDRLARTPGWGAVPTGLLFTGIIFLAGKIAGLPFSLYDTFVIEERYGFNRTSGATFAADWIKELVLVAVLGGLLLSAVLWLFIWAATWAWLLCWGVVSVFQVFIVFAAPTLIMPLFNRFTPVPEGGLADAIEGYVRKQGVPMRGIYTMDGSRRSSKGNAFFTGFGRSRRIVLYDTLVSNHPLPETVAVVAHEMGHYRHGHVRSGLARSLAWTGLLLFLLSLFIGNRELLAAFGIEQVSVHAALVLFGFLYTPVTVLMALVENAIMRRQELDADRYAVRTTGNGQAMIDGLKRLSVDNLSNLTPHPLKLALAYGHPPVTVRVRAIRATESATGVAAGT